MRVLIETFKTINARRRAARRAGLRSFTVVLDWTAPEYAHYAPEIVRVRASSPLAAEMDALLQAGRGHLMHVSQFEGLEGRALVIAAGEQMKVIATFEGSPLAVSSNHF